MDSILDSLKNEDEWISFLKYKEERDQLTKKELESLKTFIAEKRYDKVSAFGYPVKREITKMGSSKKRIVYSFSEDETWMLKLLAYKLYKYDDKVPENCYSFRRSKTAKTAFDRIRSIEGLDSKYCLKLDIHDYFNSIDTHILLSILSSVIDDDKHLLSFLEELLLQDRCIWQGEVIEEKRGAMAGVPLASFFANIYLAELDRHFEDMDIPYLRYSDDMILFPDTEEELKRSFEFINAFLLDMGLELNMEKYKVSKPGEKWEFLGFSYERGVIDLSDATIKKIKGKIRRKARKILRWKERKGKSYEKAARALINSFDRMFYDIFGDNSFTWSRFYFPVINTHKGLKEIDLYMVKYLRFLYSGRHYKGNYKVSYEDLKRLGYTPLVAEYYNWKKENELLKKGML